MSADGIYVEITVSAKTDFASDAKKAIEQAFEKGIKRAGSLTTDAPKDKKSPRWLLTATFNGAPDKDGKTYTGKLDAILAAMNATASAAKLSGNGTVDMAKAGKLAAGDVALLAGSIAEDLIRKAIDPMKKLKS
jgi:hypothetical protein